jgi:hypothetical protein
MDLNDVIKKLNRYEFGEKIRQINSLSLNSIIFFSTPMQEKAKLGPWNYPWVVDTYAALCLLSKDDSFYGKKFGTKECDRDMNAIMQSIFSSSLNFSGLPDVATGFGPLLAQQIPYQLNIRYPLYRYYRIFDAKGPIHEMFQKKTRCDSYFIYASFVALLEALIHGVKRPTDDMVRVLQLALGKIQANMTFFARTRSQFNEMQKQWVTKNTLADVTYSFKPLTLYPFLSNGDSITLLTPHALPYALTDGLFLSLTVSDDEFKIALGKAIEQYLFSIIKESGKFDDICNDEILYGPKKRRVNPPDVTVFERGTLIFFESKTIPSRKKTRLNSEQDVEEDARKIVDAIKEVLRQYKNYQQGLYSPFRGKGYRVDDVYLVVTTIFPVNLNFDEIKRMVIQDPEYSEYGTYLATHLLITDLYCIESYYLNKTSILDDLTLYGPKKELNNVHFCKARPQGVIDSYGDFINKCANECESFIDSIENIVIKK